MPLPSPLFLMFMFTSTAVLTLVGWRWHKASLEAEEARDRLE